MKKYYLVVLLCVTFAINAQNGAPKAFGKRGFLEFGVSTLFLQPSDGASRSFFGPGFYAGGYVTKNSCVGVEANLNFLISKQEEVGMYSYPSRFFYDKREVGTVTKTYNVFPILGTWALSLDLSEKVRFNVGPVLGTTLFQSYHALHERNSTTSNLPFFEDSDNLPDITKAAFSYGGEAAFLFKLKEGVVGNTYLGVRYKYIRNTGPAFDEEKLAGTMHQVKLIINLTW